MITCPSHPKDFAQLTQRNWTLLQGFFTLGKKPTGDKDPFGLRRASGGIVRILIEGEINTSLSENITIALSNFETNLDQNQTRKLIMQFIFERFKSYLLEKNIDICIVKCIQKNSSDSIFDKFRQALALQEFLKLDDSNHIINGQKRIKNILKKNPYKENLHFNAELCSENAEKTLSENFYETQRVGEVYLENKKYLEYLCTLTKLTQSIEQFFWKLWFLIKMKKLREIELAF